MTNNEILIGDEFYTELENDEYLHETYDNILYNYSIKLLNVKDGLSRPVNVDHALRFADLLSKSNHSTKSDTHKIWAQEIVALLDKLSDGKDPVIKHFLGSVLSNTGNILGELHAGQYKSLSPYDKFFHEFNKELLRVPVEGENTHFFRTQKQAFDKFGNDYFSYSGPTSMGKSFIMRMFLKKQVQENESMNFAILVPTKALINEVKSEVTEDLRNLLSDKNYKIVTSAGSLFLRSMHNFIFILTPERLLYLLISQPQIDLDYLFIDEAHKISSKDARSTFYYKVVGMLSRRRKRPHIIFASPNIPNPEVYLKLIPEANLNENKIAAKFAPVSQMKYFIDIPNCKILLFNKYNHKLSILVPKINEKSSFGQIVKYISQKSKITKNKQTGNNQTIVYCSSKAKTLELARDFAKSEDEIMDNPSLKKLSSEIMAEIHGDCFLAELVRKGIAYHVGYLPSSIRLKIEELYKNGDIRTLFCTSTLVEGVNLPADNLFITSYYSGNSIMQEVDFMNLVGRVGRIKYNLFGNVFLARLEDNKNNRIERFEEFLQSEVPEQKLSVVTELTKPQKQHIVNCLSQGSMELLKYPKDQPAENYELMRKFAIILVKDIVKNRTSIVRFEFAQFLSDDIEEKIRSAFDSKKDRMDDDINISVDQTETLAQAIADGLEYPKLDFSVENGRPYISHENLMIFLNQLCDIFKWEKYEFSTIGALSKKTGERSKLGHYAVILSRWLQGYGVRFIIESTIQYLRDNNKDIRLPDNSYVRFDFYNKEHKNIIIGETLDDIENVILFKISNYFLKFSTEYKKIHGKPPVNDWYEYVEYGTTDELSIFFQRNGLSRETANYIKLNYYYKKFNDGEYRLLNSIKNCEKESVVREIFDLMYNAPELFVD